MLARESNLTNIQDKAILSCEGIGLQVIQTLRLFTSRQNKITIVNECSHHSAVPKNFKCAVMICIEYCARRFWFGEP